MFRRKILPLAIAAVLATGAASAVFASHGNSDDRQEAAAAQSATVSLAQAVAAAEKHSSGYAISAGMEQKRGTFRYQVKTLTKDRESEILIDPTTGAVIGTQREGVVERLLEREDRAELAKLQSGKTTLAGAISAAEQASGGKAFEAAFENENGTAGFQIEVAKNGGTQRFLVEAATGKVVSLAASDQDEEHEDEHED
ncbi:MAG TPA: PepSY domain-containing protein [Burkholderiales bacterium]|nr:PepSY domain-containing protein [Burkholderiales bacterium]